MSVFSDLHNGADRWHASGQVCGPGPGHKELPLSRNSSAVPDGTLSVWLHADRSELVKLLLQC